MTPLAKMLTFITALLLWAAGDRMLARLKDLTHAGLDSRLLGLLFAMIGLQLFAVWLTGVIFYFLI